MIWVAPSEHDITAGTLVATNLANMLKTTIVPFANELAGLKSGKDVLVEF